jgi:catecholate siderophore receptor
MGISTAMLLPLGALAQSAQTPAAEATAMPEVRVEAQKIDPNPNAEVGAPYKARTSGDPRHTRPLAETPQTIQVITGDAIKDSGKTDLRDILDGQPGITLGTGENGNAFGDRYIIRGQEARSDVFVDGLRDPGMTTRETFAIEQLEITKGPNSSFAGRGTSGGAINAITKQATLDYDFYRLSGGLGTDSYKRFTLDANKAFSDQLALRANVLWADEDVPDRSPASRARKGMALSGLYEVNRDLSITLDYYGLRAKDNPDLGYYLVGTAPDRRPAGQVPVYAQSQDFQESDVDTFSARIRYALSPVP